SQPLSCVSATLFSSSSFLPLPPPPPPPLFPYTTLFRSCAHANRNLCGVSADHAAAKDHHTCRGYAGHTAQQDAATATHLFQIVRSEEHTSELQSRVDLVCRLLLEKKNKQ